jgi:hypothetical protein
MRPSHWPEDPFRGRRLFELVEQPEGRVKRERTPPYNELRTTTMTRKNPTYRTTDYDTAAGVSDRTQELPTVEIDPSSHFATFIFFESTAPEAARQFRSDYKIQNYIAAKKTILRLFRMERDRQVRR